MSDDAFARFERHQLDKQIVSDDESRQDHPDSADPWEKLLRRVETRAGVLQVFNSDGRREWRVKSRHIFSHILGIPPERTNGTSQGRRLAAVMRKLNWHGPRYMYFGKKEYAKGYFKTDTA